MDTETYGVFLVLGAVIVIIDGQLLLRVGRAYLKDAYPDRTAATAVNYLIAVLFHLVMLGVLAVISVFMRDAATLVQTFVLNIGILLLVVAAGHAVTIAVLGQLRRGQLEQRLLDETTAARSGRAARQFSGRSDHEGPVMPVGPQTGEPRPVVGPAIDAHEPYRAS